MSCRAFIGSHDYSSFYLNPIAEGRHDEGPLIPFAGSTVLRSGCANPLAAEFSSDYPTPPGSPPRTSAGAIYIVLSSDARPPSLPSLTTSSPATPRPSSRSHCNKLSITDADSVVRQTGADIDTLATPAAPWSVNLEFPAEPPEPPLPPSTPTVSALKPPWDAFESRPPGQVQPCSWHEPIRSYPSGSIPQEVDVAGTAPARHVGNAPAHSARSGSLQTQDDDDPRGMQSAEEQSADPSTSRTGPHPPSESPYTIWRPSMIQPPVSPLPPSTPTPYLTSHQRPQPTPAPMLIPSVPVIATPAPTEPIRRVTKAVSLTPPCSYPEDRSEYERLLPEIPRSMHGSAASPEVRTMIRRGLPPALAAIVPGSPSANPGCSISCLDMTRRVIRLLGLVPEALIAEIEREAAEEVVAVGLCGRANGGCSETSKGETEIQRLEAAMTAPPIITPPTALGHSNDVLWSPPMLSPFHLSANAQGVL